MRSWTLVGALLTMSAGTAHADRLADAATLFADNCARCHAPDSLRRKTAMQPNGGGATRFNLKSITAHSLRGNPERGTPAETAEPASDPLLTWLARPNALDANSVCESWRLDEVQRDVLIAFLRRPDDPRARQVRPEKAPAAAHARIAPAPQRRGPKLGQGDHR